MCNFFWNKHIKSSIMELNSSDGLFGTFQSTSFCSSQSIFSLKQVVLSWDRTHNEKGLWGEFCKTPLVDNNAEFEVELCSQPLTRPSVCSDDLRQQWWPFATWWPRAMVMTFPQLMTLEEWSFICNDLKSIATTTSLTEQKKRIYSTNKKNMLLRQKKKVFKTNFSRSP